VVPALEPTQTPALQRLDLDRPAREIVEAKELAVVAKTTRVVVVVVRDQLDQLGLRTEEEMEEMGERLPSPELESSLQAVEVVPATRELVESGAPEWVAREALEETLVQLGPMA
jgi:hypothetical protein